MKIALVCTKFSPAYGGLEKYTLFLARALRDAGHAVHLFANRWEAETGLHFHHVPRIPFVSPLKNLSFAYWANRRLAPIAFDVIHSMERIFYQDIFRASDGINPVQMRQKYPRPLVRKFKAAGPRRQVLSYLERRIFAARGCRYVMTNSELVKGHIVAHYAVDPAKIVVIYNGVDTQTFNPGVRSRFRAQVRAAWGVSDRERIVLFVANDFKRKGLQSLLEALRLTADPHLRLIVVGRDDPKPYRRWARRHGLGRRVLFVGPHKAAEQCYGAADIFALPTIEDAFANVCLEAMACALPVITTPSNGAAELIEEGLNGFVVECGRAPELARRLQLTASAQQCRHMGQNAAQTARRYTLDNHLREVMRLYRRVASGGSGP